MVCSLSLMLAVGTAHASTKDVSDRDIEIWDRVAPSYDRVLRLVGGRYPSVLDRLRRDLAGRRRVLEVGAGTGLITLPLAELIPELVATDVSTKMLEILERKLRASGRTGVEVLKMSVHDLGFPDAHFDAAVCCNVLHVIRDPERALDELWRVLKPDALLVAPTFCHGATPVARTISRCMSLVSRFRAHSRFTPDSLALLVKRHGFLIRSLENLGGPVPLFYLSASRSEGS